MAHSKECSGFCNCAKCHCGILIGAKIQRGTGFESWSNYKCAKDDTVCISCGKCVERCPMKAMTVAQDEKVVFNKRDASAADYALPPVPAVRCSWKGSPMTDCPSRRMISFLITRKGWGVKKSSSIGPECRPDHSRIQAKVCMSLL